jgi:transposase
VRGQGLAIDLEITLVYDQCASIHGYGHRPPPRIVEKSLVSDRVVVDTVVSKYADHCPLYRQSVMLERDSGVALSRQTLDGWVMRVGQLLVPLAEELRQELLRGSYLQADETPVGVQMHDGKGSNHLAHLWQYGQPHGACGVRLSHGTWA